MRFRLPHLFAFAAALAVGSFSRATPLSVVELGIGANQVVKITSSTLSPSGVNVYAGVVKLTVDGVATDAFCIDPWHWSVSGATPYELVPLGDAPKDPVTGAAAAGMGSAAAHAIGQLWAQYYTPSIDNLTAAALQVKIWEIVDGAVTNGSFSLLTNDASLNAKLGQMTTFLATNPHATVAPLAGITTAYTTSHAGQDYVIAHVPDDAGTALLFGLGALALVVARRRRT